MLNLSLSEIMALIQQKFYLFFDVWYDNCGYDLKGFVDLIFVPKWQEFFLSFDPQNTASLKPALLDLNEQSFLIANMSSPKPKDQDIGKFLYFISIYMKALYIYFYCLLFLFSFLMYIHLFLNFSNILKDYINIISVAYYNLIIFFFKIIFFLLFITKFILSIDLVFIYYINNISNFLILYLFIYLLLLLFTYLNNYLNRSFVNFLYNYHFIKTITKYFVGFFILIILILFIYFLLFFSKISFFGALLENFNFLNFSFFKEKWQLNLFDAVEINYYLVLQNNLKKFDFFVFLYYDVLSQVFTNFYFLLYNLLVNTVNLEIVYEIMCAYIFLFFDFIIEKYFFFS
jgi:hypothetical protein